MQKETSMTKHNIPSDSDSDATFIGWQRSLKDDDTPLFNITATDHPLYQSTVTEATLRRLHLQVPKATSPYHDSAPVPWHLAGIELNHPGTAKSAIKMAGLDYTVLKKPGKAEPGLKDSACAIVRADTGEVLGSVKASYEPVQNMDAFEFFDALVAEGEATYETAGFLGKGECIWILAKLPGYMKVRGNDIVNKYLLLTNSHDGRSQVGVRLTPIRAVCNNTLTSALQGAGDISIRHAPNTVKYYEQAFTILGLSNSLYEQLHVKFNGMAARKITQAQLREYVQALIPDNEEKENKAKTEKIRQVMLHLYDSGQGADLARGTVWGAFNSVAEYADHLMLGENPTTRLNSIWFGHAEKLKSKAFLLAEKLMGYEPVIRASNKAVVF
jgi:phage/plasmid-like protein (TIGR03299 family)